MGGDLQYARLASMRTLYHLWLTPNCRAVRIALAEKGLDFELVLEKTWERRIEFLTLDPAGEVPVLVEADGAVIGGSGAILEYLEDVYKTPSLIGTAPLTGAPRVTGPPRPMTPGGSSAKMISPAGLAEVMGASARPPNLTPSADVGTASHTLSACRIWLIKAS